MNPQTFIVNIIKSLTKMLHLFLYFLKISTKLKIHIITAKIVLGF